MTGVLEMFAREFWSHLTQALLHTLWQGALVAGLVYLILKRTAADRPAVRYGVAVAGMAAMVFLAGATWAVLEYESRPAIHQDLSPAASVLVEPSENHSSTETVSAAGPVGRGVAGGPSGGSDVPSAAVRPAGGDSETWTGWLAGAWLAGVVLMVIRAVLSITGAGRLRRSCRQLDDTEINVLASQLQQAMGIGRRVRVAVSEHISVPAVLGVFWPTVLLPASVLTGLPPDHLRAILAHELAHIRRYDYLVNLAQMLVEALLFFNPAVWWISRQIRNEREACCDALAAETTGEAGRYVHALLTVAERAHGAAPLPDPAAAMAESDRPGSLSDRAMRLLARGHRAVPRLGWRGLIAFLVLGGAGVAALFSGAFMTVSVAARLLDHQQRAEKFVEIRDSHGQYPRSIYEEPVEREPVTVRGEVRTHDGAPLPAGSELWLCRVNRPPDISVITREIELEGEAFEETFYEFDRLYLCATAPGYAPAFAGPLKPDSATLERGVELTLKKGEPVRLKVVDAEGRPVAGARVRGKYDFPAEYTFSSKVDLPEAVTNESGEVVFADCRPMQAHLLVRAPGYEVKRFVDAALSTTTPQTLSLQPTQPATGVVVARASGEPIAGATVRLIAEIGPAETMHFYPHQPGSAGTRGEGPIGRTGLYSDIRTTTTGEGRFALDTLRSDAEYIFMVEAPDFAPEFIRDVRAGDNGLRVALGPEIVVRGKVTGDISPLLKNAGRRGPEILYIQRFQYDEDVTPVSLRQWVTLEKRDGDLHFEIRDLWEGYFSVRAGSATREFDLAQSVDDLVIDLETGETRPDWAEYPMRPVVLRFQTPEDAPPPTGEVGIKVSVVKGKRGYIYWQKRLPIEDGEIGFKAPAPGRIHLERARDVAGFWFDLQLHDVPAGSTTHTIAVETIPAGAIYGRFLEADGSPAEGAQATIFNAKKSRWEKGTFWGIPARRAEEDGKFMIGPVPLDWIYVIKAYRKNYLVFSKPYRLNAGEPFQELEFRFEDGAVVTGKVVGPDKAPVQLAKVSLSHRLDGHHHTLQTVRTNERGRFAFDGVNPEAPGQYVVEVSGVEGLKSDSREIENFRRPLSIRLEER